MKTAELVIEEINTDRGTYLSVKGELDLTTVNQLRGSLLAQVLRYAPNDVALDLTSVDFIDSAGLALLVESRKRLAAESRKLYLVVSAGKQPERVLRLVRFDTIMTLVHSIDDVPAQEIPVAPPR